MLCLSQVPCVTCFLLIFAERKMYKQFCVQTKMHLIPVKHVRETINWHKKYKKYLGWGGGETHRSDNS